MAFNLNNYFGIVGDFGGYESDHLTLGGAPPINVHADGSAFSYMFGPRVSFRSGRLTPFAQYLLGGLYATRVKLPGCSGGAVCTALPSENAFAMTAGGGVDVTLTRHFALRVIQVEYMFTRFRDPTSSTGQTARQNDVRLSTGIVFRMGGNPPPPPPAGPPVASCSADKSMVYVGSGEVVVVRVNASDAGNNPLTYSWTRVTAPSMALGLSRDGTLPE